MSGGRASEEGGIYIRKPSEHLDVMVLPATLASLILPPSGDDVGLPDSLPSKRSTSLRTPQAASLPPGRPSSSNDQQSVVEEEEEPALWPAPACHAKGAIPDELGRCGDLERLQLQENQLAGGVPASRTPCRADALLSARERPAATLIGGRLCSGDDGGGLGGGDGGGGDGGGDGCGSDGGGDGGEGGGGGKGGGGEGGGDAAAHVRQHRARCEPAVSHASQDAYPVSAAAAASYVSACTAASSCATTFSAANAASSSSATSAAAALG